MTIWHDITCPHCGEQMTHHVILTRHENGPCDAEFRGPRLSTELEGSLIMTERTDLLDALMKITKLVPHDSEVYQIAVEQISSIVYWGKRENND